MQQDCNIIHKVTRILLTLKIIIYINSYNMYVSAEGIVLYVDFEMYMYLRICFDVYYQDWGQVQVLGLVPKNTFISTSVVILKIHFVALLLVA